MEEEITHYHFHGGCFDCINNISMCPECCYMEAKWELPNLNTVGIKKVKARQKQREESGEDKRWGEEQQSREEERRQMITEAYRQHYTTTHSE